MVRCFSEVVQHVFPPGALTNEIYETALYNLRIAFTFVGHQEEAGKLTAGCATTLAGRVYLNCRHQIVASWGNRSRCRNLACKQSATLIMEISGCFPVVRRDMQAVSSQWDWAKALMKQSAPRSQSLVAWFTGLSGAGKSTLCSSVAALLEVQNLETEVLDAPLAVCETRDVKGLYKKARQGLLKNVVGIDVPYEPPRAADLEVHTDLETIEESTARIVAKIQDALRRG